jgi:predicted ATP-dependent endonuclease of OLD family
MNKKMEKINPLTGITLGGFQVFDELTYIPLDRLTFLFGPNSAGKSSIQDAIEMVDVVEADSKRFF